MKRLADFIVKHRLIFCIVFGALVIASCIAIPFVEVNYNDIEYLPKDSDIYTGLQEMRGDFGNNGNSALMVKNVSVKEAAAAKDKILNINGVKEVIWLDDLLTAFTEGMPEKMLEGEKPFTVTEADCTAYMLEVIYAVPENASEMSDIILYTAIISNLNLFNRSDADVLTRFLALLMPVMEENADYNMIKEFKPQIESFYKDNNALMQIIFEKDDYDDATLNAIQNIKNLNYDVAMTGAAVTTYNSIDTVNIETTKAMIVVFAVILVILFLTSTSYWEPVLYLAAIGIAVLINMGSNIILGKISYMTQGVASVLQLALTMDYSIFLLNRYKRERINGAGVTEAVSTAIQKSLSPVSASSLTTIAGFVALMFMKYRLGLDMGLVLTKGIVVSLLSVFFVLPGLIVFSHKLIEKSEHKSFKLTFKKTSRGLVKSRFYLPFIIIAIILPCAYIQSLNTFTYGSEASLLSKGTEGYEDKQDIEKVFGNQNQYVVLIPYEYAEKEGDLCRALLEMREDGVLSVQSLSLIKESGFETAMPEKFLSQFSGKEKYTRIILNLNVENEGEETEILLNKLQDVLSRHLDGAAEETSKRYYILGESPATAEIKAIVNNDYSIITYISIALVGLILLVTYKSLVIPVLLLLVIQFSIYVNMSVPYLTGSPIVFVGYMIISAILLGATIDYAILMTTHYMENRRTMDRFDAARHAMAQSSRALITSAGVLAFSGFAMGFISSMPATAVFGQAIGRGGVISFLFVIFLLPQLLMLLDKPIRLTTFRGKKIMIENIKADSAPEIIKNEED